MREWGNIRERKTSEYNQKMQNILDIITIVPEEFTFNEALYYSVGRLSQSIYFFESKTLGFVPDEGI